MSATKAGKRPLRSLTAHEKLEAIRRVHDGESKASVARDIGVPESTLRGWCKNEDKISYLSRQSSPETDESSLPAYEPKEKKPKLEETATDMTAPTTGVIAPFNLSLKPPMSYSPNAEASIKFPLDNTAVDSTNIHIQPTSTATTTINPMNLTTSSTETATKSVTTNGCTSSSMNEREKNRAELARLSVELGLNRPEMFMTGGSTSAGSVADLTANIGLLAHQWNNLLLQQQMNKSAAASLPTVVSNKQKPPKLDTAAANATINQLLNYNKLLDTKKLPKVDPPKSVEDSVWYWLKTQQAMLGLNQNLQNGTAGNATISSTSTLSASMPTTACSTSAVVSTTTPQTPPPPPPPPPPMPPLPSNAAGLDLNNSSWFWKWYKQYTSQLQTALIATTPATKPILYQQLTKMKSENIETGDDAEKSIANRNGTTLPSPPTSSNKSRSVLDNILLNNNNNVGQKDGKEDDLSQSEALEHGEKFLRWLECCSEPSVTAMQIMQFRSLVNNIKTGADRKNGEQKTKVRRK